MWKRWRQRTLRHVPAREPEVPPFDPDSFKENYDAVSHALVRITISKGARLDASIFQMHHADAVIRLIDLHKLYRPPLGPPPMPTRIMR